MNHITKRVVVGWILDMLMVVLTNGWWLIWILIRYLRSLEGGA